MNFYNVQQSYFTSYSLVIHMCRVCYFISVSFRERKQRMCESKEGGSGLTCKHKTYRM